MNKWFIVIALLMTSHNSHAGLSSWLFGYDSFDECIIDSMPGVQSDREAKAILADCKQDHSPTAHVEKKQTYLKVETADACLAEYGMDFKSQVAAMWIRRSCYRLFN